MKSLDLVRIAFQKLKAHVYYDKSALLLRDNLVEFEGHEGFESNLEALAKVYENSFQGSDSQILTEILDSIGVQSI